MYNVPVVTSDSTRDSDHSHNSDYQLLQRCRRRQKQQYRQRQRRHCQWQSVPRHQHRQRSVPSCEHALHQSFHSWARHIGSGACCIHDSLRSFGICGFVVLSIRSVCLSIGTIPFVMPRRCLNLAAVPTCSCPCQNHAFPCSMLRSARLQFMHDHGPGERVQLEHASLRRSFYIATCMFALNRHRQYFDEICYGRWAFSRAVASACSAWRPHVIALLQQIWIMKLAFCVWAACLRCLAVLAAM